MAELTIADLPEPAQGIAVEVASFVDDPYDRCYAASMTLARDLTNAGLTAVVFEVHGFQGDTSRLDPRWLDFLSMLNSSPGALTHFFVSLEGLAIDLTFRQIDYNALPIRILPLADALNEWALSQPVEIR